MQCKLVEKSIKLSRTDTTCHTHIAPHPLWWFLLSLLCFLIAFTKYVKRFYEGQEEQESEEEEYYQENMLICFISSRDALVVMVSYSPRAAFSGPSILSVIFRSYKFGAHPPAELASKLFVEFDTNLDGTYRRLIYHRGVRWSEYSAWRSLRSSGQVHAELTARRRVSSAAGMTVSGGDLSTLYLVSKWLHSALISAVKENRC